MKSTFLIFVFLASLNFIAQGQALKVLFVGNSYTVDQNLTHLVSLIADSTDTPLITKKSTLGGSWLSDHWNGKNELKTKDLIESGEFDIVILQEYSMGTILKPDTFQLYVKKFSELIRKNGAKPYLYCTWAREKVPQYQETITAEYQKAGTANEVEVVLVGEAWKLARSYRLDNEFFKGDGSHPNKLGALLTACTFVEAITGQLPSKLPQEYSVNDSKGERVRIAYYENPLDIEFCLKVVQELNDL